MGKQTHFLFNVKIDDLFWNHVRETVRKEGIPYQWKALNDELPPDTEPSHCMKNFRIAAGKEKGEHWGWAFQDSDVAKWLEAVAYSLMWHPDAELEKTADQAIEAICAAQQPDGYLGTYYTIKDINKRWTNLKDHHELYVAGHMIEAAVAYYQVTGKRKLLDACLKLVDLIDSLFGPEENKRKGYPGHPVIEMALMRLYEITKDEKHLKLAKYFVDQRGQEPLYFKEETEKYQNTFPWKDSPYQYQYYQAGKPVREQKTAEGHSVRALYLYSGMVDVAHATNDRALMNACKTLWNNVVHKQMYITGAVGATEYGEAFTFDYDLPNDTVYGETCASIALMFLARRMLAVEKRGEYADVMERVLYNSIISGMQLDGKRFFYVNPLEVNPLACEKDYNKRHVMPERQKWFGCACCPPNLNRLVCSLEQYIYAATEDTLYTYLYVGGSGEAEFGGRKVTFCTETNYPWQGDVALTFETAAPVRFRLALHIPGWCRKYIVRCNGEECAFELQDGYAYIDRIWNSGDRIELTMEMPVVLNRANPHVAKDAGLCAVTRGPMVYCLEGVDNGADLHAITLENIPASAFAAETSDVFGTPMVLLQSPGWRETAENWGDELYAFDIEVQKKPVQLKWIPYFAWANRGLTEMRVWIRK